jgi:ankyrin repeat protein
MPTRSPLLNVTIFFGRFVIVALLIAGGIGLLSHAPQPRLVARSLHEAAVFDASQIPRIVFAGAEIDGLDADGHTPLWLAARLDKVDAVKQLLALGADPNFGGPDADTPLLVGSFLALDPEATAIAALLIEAGADVNTRDRLYQQTPLHLSENQPIVELLLAAGADVNAQDVNGSTPLQSAVARGLPAIAGLLLSAGADPELRNDAGFRPIDQLNACSNPGAIQSVFRAHGADDQRRPELFSLARGANER